MSDASRGPVSTLPGARFSPKEGAVCDDHQDRPAVHRVQGETDSFGCEYNDMCQECYDEYKRYEHEHSADVGRCDLCENEMNDLRPWRDPDEGLAGPVYQVCGSCRSERNADFAFDGDDDF